jgi:hypothetical protein
LPVSSAFLGARGEEAADHYKTCTAMRILIEHE